MRRALLIGVLLLGACTVGPNYQPPKVALPAAWPAQSAPQSPANLPDARDWWRDLGETRLNALVARALKDNLDIEQALARIDQARAQAGLARANQLPAAEVDGSLARSRQSLDAGLGQISHYVPSYPRVANEGQLGLSAAWQLDFAGGNRRAREAALAQLSGAHAGADAARLTVAGAVAEAYIDLRTTQARLANLTERRALLAQRRQIMSARIRLGEAPRTAGNDMDAALAGIDAVLPPLRSAVILQRNRIDVLVGLAAGTDLPELAPERAGDDHLLTAPLPADPAAGTPAQMLRRRPDLRIAEARLIAANAQIGAAMAEYWPKLSLSALAGFDSTQLSSFGSGPSQVLTGAVGLRWRLFDFARVQAGIDAAHGATREALAAYRGAVLQAGADVENAYAQLAASRGQADARINALTAARAALASTQRAERLGQISRDALLEARINTLAAEDEAIAARGGAWAAAVGCNRAIGG